MSRIFNDATLNDLVVNIQKGDMGIPIIDNIRTESSACSADLFVITGKAQTYKTTLAVEIMKKIMDMSPGSQSIWVDCDFKFPIHCLKDKEVDLTRLYKVQCKCSEQILFILQKIHFQVQTTDSNLTTVVIDGLSSSYWIDQNTLRQSSSIQNTNVSVNGQNQNQSQLSSKKTKIFTQVKQIIDSLVYELGLKVIVTLHYLGDFNIWNLSRYNSTQYLECVLISPGKGFVRCDEICDRFEIGENRAFKWGKRGLVKHVLEYMKDEEQKTEDNEEDGTNIVI